jgi:hydroxypyruvate isomerase
MAGNAAGAEAEAVFEANLAFAFACACAEAANHGLTILIEPLSPHDAPGYFLNSLEKAAQIIARLGQNNLKLMFDCYHVGRTEGDVIGHLRALYPIIGHIEFASVPLRQSLDQGSVDFEEVFVAIEDMGWTGPLGAEYKPMGKTEASLGWMQSLGELSGSR